MLGYALSLLLIAAVFAESYRRLMNKETKHPPQQYGMRIYGERMTFAELNEPPI